MPDEDEFEPGDGVDDTTLEDWQEVARQVPDIELSQEEADLLGRRNIDNNYDWTPHIARYHHEGFTTRVSPLETTRHSSVEMTQVTTMWRSCPSRLGTP